MNAHFMAFVLETRSLDKRVIGIQCLTYTYFLKVWWAYMTSLVYKKKCINFSKEAYASYGTKAIYVV